MQDGHSLAMGLRAAYLTMHRRANAAVADLGLTADQFVLLTALVESDAVSQAELVRRTASDPNTLSAMLARLERRGLIHRQAHDGDGRVRRVSLSEEGRGLQALAWNKTIGFRADLVAVLSPDENAKLIEQLHRLAASWSEGEPSKGSNRRKDPARTASVSRKTSA